MDPGRLATSVPGSRGADLATAFATSAVGDQVARDGIVVPVLGVDPGHYDLHVHHVDQPGAAGEVVVRSPGWVLETGTGHLLLTTLGRLAAWEPDDPRHHWVRVPAGSYAVELRGVRATPTGTADGSYSWVLRPTVRPWFTADVG